MNMNEEDRRPAQAFPPGDFIQEEIEARGWSQADFAQIIEKPLPAVNQIIKGKRAVVPETAKRIAAAFGQTAQFWMNLETNWQLYNSEPTDEERVREYARLYDLIPVREMQRRNWIEKTKSATDLEEKIIGFFGVANLTEIPHLPQAARMAVNHENALAAVSAWCQRAFWVSQFVQAGEFNSSRIPDLVEKLKLLLGESEGVQHVPSLLGEYGIRFVVVEHLKGTHLDGAAVLKPESKPVLAMSLRRGRLDYFWFTLMHELAHIYYEDGQQWDADILGERSEDQHLEIRADKFAEEAMVAPDGLESFIESAESRYSTNKIMSFSRATKVHPAIILGQLKHRGELYWSQFARLHNRIDVRDLIKNVAVCDGWGQLPRSELKVVS